MDPGNVRPFRKQKFCLDLDGNAMPFRENTTFRSNILSIFIVEGSRDSAVGIATGYGLDGREVGVPVPLGARFFSSRYRPGWF
jgi:hypothetical protein